MTLPDADRLSRAASGDGAAFEALVQAHQAAVYRFLMAQAESPQDAEDALQETFLAAWRAAASFRGAGSARGWLLSIARNALARLHRRRVGQPGQFESIDDLGCQAGWGAIPADDTLLEGLARRDLVERALARVPLAEREVVILRDVEGIPGEEVARITGVSLPAMKSRLHRGRLRLAAALEELRHG